MTAIRVEVTAEHIAAAGPVPDPMVVGADFLPEGHRDPVELAIAEVTGQSVGCDSDVPDGEMATIGDGRTVLVQNLPAEVSPWIERYYKGQTVEPFEFDMEIEDWLVDLIRFAT